MCHMASVETAACAFSEEETELVMRSAFQREGAADS